MTRSKKRRNFGASREIRKGSKALGSHTEKRTSESWETNMSDAPYEPFQDVKWMAANGHVLEGRANEKGRIIYSLGTHSSDCPCMKEPDYGSMESYCGEEY